MGDDEDQRGGEPREGKLEPFRLPLVELVHLFGDPDLSGDDLAGDLVRGQVEEVGLVETIEPVAAEAFVDARPQNTTRTADRGRSGDQRRDEGDAKGPAGIGVEDASFLGKGEEQRHQGDDSEDDPTARALLGVLSGVALTDLGRKQLIGEADVGFTVRLSQLTGHEAKVPPRPAALAVGKSEVPL